jgi:RNase P/RNase MRP subunit p29
MWIGKTVTIKEAKNKSITGKQGQVLDETKNTITIKTHTREITIIKDQIITITEE